MSTTDHQQGRLKPYTYATAVMRNTPATTNQVHVCAVGDMWNQEKDTQPIPMNGTKNEGQMADGVNGGELDSA